jgi:hypothetical protein
MVMHQFILFNNEADIIILRFSCHIRKVAFGFISVFSCIHRSRNPYQFTLNRPLLCQQQEEGTE